MPKMNLDPETGRALITAVTGLCDDTIISAVTQAYNHVKLLGENAATAQFEEKFMALQKQYNEAILPAFTTAQDTFKEYTNYAELQAAFKADTDVDHSATGAASAEGLGAQRQNLQKLTDIIS